MNNEEIHKLLKRYLADECSDEERAYVESWYDQHGVSGNQNLSDAEIETDLHEIYERLPAPAQARVFPVWMRYAAMILVVLSAGLYFFNAGSGTQPTQVQVAKKVQPKQIVPGGNKATLTLADGTNILLDDASTGAIAQQSGNTVYKRKNGQVIYDAKATGNDNAGKVIFNTLSTPRGGQYHVILSDGTKVWLNAASSITYPAIFEGTERIVQLKGEAYFEVAKNLKKPFRVVTADQTVEVLGTHFNINSYDDEPAVKTTLIEGSVKIVEQRHRQSVILKPGQQASLGDNHQLKLIKVNSAEAIAWKSGLFRFQNSDIGTVMRQFSRWYDVEIVFEGKTPDLRLWGEVYRKVNITEALDIISYFNFKYRIEDVNGVKKIVIYS